MRDRDGSFIDDGYREGDAIRIPPRRLNTMRTNETSEKEMARLRARSESERLKFVGAMNANEPSAAETPTPDTDEAQFGTGRVSVDFARRLERKLIQRTAELAALRIAVAGVASELVTSLEWARKDTRSFEDVLRSLLADCDDLAERLAAALRGEGGGQ